MTTTPLTAPSARRPARILAASFALAAVLGASACSGSGKKHSASVTPSVTTTPAPSSSATASPQPPKPQAFNYLRGGRVSGNGVIAAKIDDTANGRPQRAVDQADVVYIEEVEGGLTRLVAVFHTYLPVVEPVRSTRAADPELLAQYGPIGYVASGGAHNPLAILDRSTLKAAINDRGAGGFARDGSRPAPYNLVANLRTIAQRLHVPKAKDIGFRFSASTAQLKGKAPGVHIRTVVGGTGVAFDYAYKLHRYVRVIGGVAQHAVDGAYIAASNVIVQFCDVEPYPADRDVLGNPNAYTHTVGRGNVVVFRDGKRIYGTWSRPNGISGTTLRDRTGKVIQLAPGNTWVVLVHRNAPLQAS